MMKSKMSEVLGLGSIQINREVPGLQPTDGREIRYISDEGIESFGMFFKKIIRFVSPPIPKDGGALIEGCKITLPGGEALQAISYKGDIAGWRLQIEQGAEAFGAKIAKIHDESIIIDAVTSIPLVSCKIEFQ